MTSHAATWQYISLCALSKLQGVLSILRQDKESPFFSVHNLILGRRVSFLVVKYTDTESYLLKFFNLSIDKFSTHVSIFKFAMDISDSSLGE